MILNDLGYRLGVELAIKQAGLGSFMGGMAGKLKGAIGGPDHKGV